MTPPSKTVGVVEKARTSTGTQQPHRPAYDTNNEGYNISLSQSLHNNNNDELRSPSTNSRPRNPPPRTTGTPYLRRGNNSKLMSQKNDSKDLNDADAADLVAASKRRSRFLIKTKRKNDDSDANNIPKFSSPYWRRDENINDADTDSVMAVLEPDIEFVADDTTKGYRTPFTTTKSNIGTAERRSPPLPPPSVHSIRRRPTQRPPLFRDEDDAERGCRHLDDDLENQAPTNNRAQQQEEEDKKKDVSLLHSLCQTAQCVADLQQAISCNLISVENAAFADLQNKQTALHVLSQNQTLAQATFGGNTRQSSSSIFAASSSSSSSSLNLVPSTLDRAASSSSNTTTTTTSISMIPTEHHHQKSNANHFTTTNTTEEQLTHFVVNVLWSAYPAAMMTTDVHGYIPFESALRDWVDWTYQSEANRNQQQRRSNSNRSLVSGQHTAILPNLWLAAAPSLQTLKAAGNSVTSRWTSTNGYQHHRDSSKRTLAALNDNDNNKAEPDIEQGRRKQIPRDRIFPTRVHMKAHALCAVKMLSAMLDTMESATTKSISTNGGASAADGNTRGKQKYRRTHQHRQQAMLNDLHNITVQDMSSSIVHSVASIPDLVKTILFVEDKELRNQCLRTTLLRLVLTSKYSVGSWLTGMLQSHEKNVSDLAIEYLRLVSDASQDDDDFATVSSNGDNSTRPRTNKFLRGRVESKDEFYKEVSRLQDFLPSLLSLDDVDIEEAATTKLVQQVLDQIISRPFVVTVVFCDAIFLAILIAGFRGAINGILLGSASSSVLRYIYLSNVGLLYFLIREAGKAISLCMITRRARVYFWSFWNITDLLTTILALISTVAIRSHLVITDKTTDGDDSENSWLRYLIAITTGFMWMKCLNYLKGFNVKLATFVLAILQIARDILWFCLILFLLVVAASQMFFTLLASEQCRTSAEMRESRECQQSEYYLKTFAMLLGDFGLYTRSQFTSVFSIVLACFFTFLVVLLVSNIIIAASCDSWDLIRIRSHKLFGRARVMMIAELVSFQNLLQRNAKPQLTQSWWSNDSWARGRSRGSLIFFSLSLGAVVTWTVGEVSGSLAGENRKFGNILMRLGPVYVNVGLFIGIMLFLSKGVDSDDNADGEGGTQLTPWGSEWYGRYFQKTMVNLLGSTSGGESNVRGTEHQWQGRLRDEMTRIACETQQDYRTMQQSIDRIQQSETRVQADVSAIEKRLCDMSQESEAMKVDLNRFMKDVLEAVRSLEGSHA